MLSELLVTITGTAIFFFAQYHLTCLTFDIGKHAGLNFVKNFPIQRLGTRRDIADATVFLASGASAFITSNTLVVDGGSWMTGSASMATMKAHSKL